MRHVYSVIRFVPDPANGECVNIGLLAGSEDSDEWTLQTVAQRTRARQLGGIEALPGVVSYLERLATDLEEYSNARLGGQLDFFSDREPLTEGWLANLASEQRGVVQFSAPRPVDVESTEAAVDMLWDHVIVEPSRREFRFKKKHEALGAVRNALRRNKITGENLWRTARLESRGFRAPIDFAIHDKQVAYLTQCWSFQLPDKERLLDEIQSWAWAIRALRDSGGGLSVGELVQADVPPDVGLAVVYVPPASAVDRGAFAKAKSAFTDPEVNAMVVDCGRADEVADKAFAALWGAEN